MTDARPFAELVTEALERIDLPLHAVADELKDRNVPVSRRTLTNYKLGPERGGTEPSETQARAVLEALAAIAEGTEGKSDGTRANEGVTDVPRSSGSLVHVPTAPYGHSASFDRVTDNTDGEYRVTTIHADTLRQMIGGDVPLDPDGRIGLRLSFAVGDSMAPFINDGDPFLYTPVSSFVDGARYALWLGGAQADVIKRVEVLGGGVVNLLSDNPAVRTKVLRADEEPGVFVDEAGEPFDLVIQGRVVWPADTAQAVVGQIADRLTDFARSLLR